MPEAMVTLAEMAQRALARPAAAPAIEYQERWYGWGELRALADAMASQLAASGIRPDAPIAFVPRNRPSSIAALMGLIAQGRTIKMIYAFQSSAGIVRDIARLNPAAVIFDAQDQSDELLGALHEHALAGLVMGEADIAAVPGLETSDAQALALSGPVEPQIEILTSGTTGPPKQFPLCQSVIAKSFVGETGLTAEAQEAAVAQAPFLLSFPLGNISGIYSTVPTLIKGQRGVLIERFSVEAWHRYVVHYRPVSSGVPPASMQAVLDCNIPAEDLASIKYMGSGAAPLDPRVQRAWEDRYGIPILLSYGATEFGGPVCMFTPELYAEWGQSKFSSLGRPFGGSKIRVVEPETGLELPDGSEGLLEVVSGRLGPEWIRTADIGLIDEDGFLWLKGRADGAIMRGGFKILPETIERALMLHPSIAEVAVVGVSDTRLGEVPGAAIAFRPGVDQPDPAALESHLRNHVLATHIPIHWRVCEALPRTPSAKFDRPAIAALF